MNPCLYDCLSPSRHSLFIESYSGAESIPASNSSLSCTKSDKDAGIIVLFLMNAGDGEGKEGE